MNPAQDILDFLPYGNTLSKVLLYFIGSAIIAFILAPFIINILYKLRIHRVAKGDVISQSDYDKGKIGTPIMGGFIVVATVILITYLFNWERNFTFLPIGALILSSCVGGIDDLLNIFGQARKQPKPLKLHLKLIRVHKSRSMRIFYFITTPWAALKRFFLFLGSKPKSGLQVHEKIIAQAFIGITVGVWVYYKVGWSDVWIPYISSFDFLTQLINAFPFFMVDEVRSTIDIGALMIPFIAVTIMTITNAVNISDGMDGMAAGLLVNAFLGYTIIAFNLSLPFLNNSTGNEDFRYISYLCATTSGALLAYLYFNVKPARVQMGDFGALGLGTLLSVIAIVLHREFTLLFLCGVFLFNGIISRIIQKVWKKLTGTKLFRMIPLHYHFELKGWPEEKIVMRFWIISAVLTAMGIWLGSLMV
jgi:phospho-N-acetylmuramoyl-pentapeptide-transferase